MAAMKAVQLIAQGNPGQFQLRDLPDPEPAAGEVVVQVHACGLTHLDLWLEEGGLPLPIRLPRTPGCERAGRIVALGAGAQHWKAVERAAVQSNIVRGQG